MEATPGFEPGIEALQAPALPLGDVAINNIFDGAQGRNRTGTPKTGTGF